MKVKNNVNHAESKKYEKPVLEIHGNLKIMTKGGWTGVGEPEEAKYSPD